MLVDWTIDDVRSGFELDAQIGGVATGEIRREFLRDAVSLDREVVIQLPGVCDVKCLMTGGQSVRKSNLVFSELHLDQSRCDRIHTLSRELFGRRRDRIHRRRTLRNSLWVTGRGRGLRRRV